MDIYFDRIKPLFEQSGKTDAELEREMGIPPKKISQWNVRYTKSYVKYIPQIAKRFNVSSDYLLGNTDDPHPVSDLTGEGQKNKPDSVSGIELNSDYYNLTMDNRALIDSMIEKLLKSQSGD